ncbi:helix-turn-helix domain-containing protein [Patescibacteria group bacterium]|nr:helix-turn-helix domain-containing protein [Patescibacteria group bacterium]MBU1891128.1 helix-turn-helix domain-containing protein [Patescibacteria group bacterium]
MDKGLYAKELAKMLGVTDDTIINWEKDRNKPQGKNLEKAKNFLVHKI